MRAQHAIAAATAVPIGFGLKITFFCGPLAAGGAGSDKRTNMEVLEVHRHKENLPVQRFHDRTFVFSDGD